MINISEEKKYYKKMKNADGRILNSNTRYTQNNRVNLHWWSTEEKDENVGDYLSTIVCEYLLTQKGLSFDSEIARTKHLYAVGSIIQGGAQNAVIWGSGLKHGYEDIGFLFRKTRKLDVRLVRGPRTREVLIKNGYRCPEVYGDPAIIMPLIYKPEIENKRDILVILHHESQIKYDGSITPLTNDYKKFIDRICSSSLVISSSLHGIILAESYGIPAILLRDKCTDYMLKYEDYYYSTGRYEFPIAKSIEEAKNMTPVQCPDLSGLVKNIIGTFPYDLWE